jgi:hypothetical protein
VGFQKSVTTLRSSSCRPFILVDQAIQNRSTCDLFMAEVCHGVGRSGCAKLAGTVEPSAVVMSNAWVQTVIATPA